MSIINEEWRSIDGYINYQVSNIGRVRNSKTGRILKPACRSRKYLHVQLCYEGNIKNCFIHRLVANEFISNPDNKPMVDHIDGIKDNNVYTNLRYATKSENQLNIPKYITNTSGYKGVCWAKQNQKWLAQINVNNKKIYIGYFTDIIEAAKAYDKKALELCSDYAILNFPEEY